MSNRFWRKKNIAIVIISAVFLFICAAAAVNFSSRYTELSISYDELIGDGNGVKDFKINDGRLLSTSDDPWLDYKTDNVKYIKDVSINVNYLSDNYTTSEIFTMYPDGSYERYECVLSLGKNNVFLENSDKEISEVRFDLITGYGQEIGIDSVAFNSNYIKIPQFDLFISAFNILLNYTVIILPLLLGIILICLFVYVRKNREKSCLLKRYVVFIALLTALFITVIASAASIMHPSKSLTFNEFVNAQNALKEFEIKDGKLVAETEDPWIFYRSNDLNAVREVSVNVNSLSVDKTSAAVYVFFAPDEVTYDTVNFELSAGENVVIFPKYLRKISGMRFDLTSDRGVEIGLDSIIINKQEEIKKLVYSELFRVLSKQVTGILIVCFSVLGAFLGKKSISKKSVLAITLFMDKHYKLFIALMILLIYMISFYCGLFAVLPMFVLCCYLGRNSAIEFENSNKNRNISYIFLILTAVLIYILIPKSGINNLMFNIGQSYAINIFMALLCSVSFSNILLLLYSDNKEGKFILDIKHLAGIVCEALAVFIITMAIEIIAKVFFKGMSVLGAVYSVITAKNLWLNIFLVGIVFYFIKNLFGNAIGKWANMVFFLFIFIGNFIKLKYHDAIFKPMDMLQIGDFMGIVVRYVPKALLLIIGIAIAATLIFIIYKNRKYILKHKPNIYMVAVTAFMIVSMSDKIEANKFIDLGFNVDEIWLDAKDCVNREGVVTYSYIKFREILNIFPKAGENYNEDYMNQLRNEFDSISDADVSDIKPDVILIMEESLFDVEKIPEVNFSIKINSNILKYCKAATISPKYGGGTGSVEFEALTGMSNFFFLDNIVPYVTYWNSNTQRIPGITEEFNDNGYKTTAIHPNDGNAYNRDIVYSCMGFNKFMDKADLDFSDENRADDGYFKDDALADVIDDVLDESNEPQFVFAVTIENHTLYNSKYKETEVKLSSDKLSDKELHSLEQYSQGVYNADKFVAKMVDIVDNADRPTILYIWGDHLPALPAFNTLGFINDKYNKYSTPLIAYSNYKDIDIGQEYITPNQLAPQVLRDAEVDYSSYFDYIYSLREKYPVIHKEFGIDANDELIKKYEEVQYDILFGKKYLKAED